ncbi:hypothetical protein KNN17_03565 [Arthrobacter bambusae]|uniref:hypothetical protein n=1 Tax=Arthrobacter bambusae TaxID=1338426 RepID=UPI001F504AA3|nr:hypothetical protein [Arthrobacter bambusae]MCI0140650.1 hypothetical protein [Arthrobacter bambusae]
MDRHAQIIVDSLAAFEKLTASLAAADDPGSAIDSAFHDALSGIVSRLQRFDPIRLIEVTRLAFLPMAPEGEMPAPADEAGAALTELMALIALTARRDTPPAHSTDPVEDQEISRFIAEAKEKIEELLHLAQLRSFITVDPANKLAMISLLIQDSEVLMRNSSYPEMVEVTIRELLDGNEAVRAALHAGLGFNAPDAIAVLKACHQIQMAAFNARMLTFGAAMSTAAESSGDMDVDRGPNLEVAFAFTSLFEPEADEATVSIEDLAAHSGVGADRVKAVTERFRLDLGSATPEEIVLAFTTGKNPFRLRPLIVTESGRLMLPHPGLGVPAVRENLEAHLKTSPVWNVYSKHRGDLLEGRTRAALERMLPRADYRDSYEYYIPANDAESTAADPAKYTKRVEGDHLVLADDVAIVVEDKAVALSAHSRGGKTTRIRTDLTGIIKEASDQAGRVRDRIEIDGGLRVEGEGWLDLRHIREIHTIAVSLDDMSTVLTATAELVRAGLLELGNIPWTVSLHDLELISELVARPAEFLLYLRRRRNPAATVMFRAADELDLFLYFYEAGLWTEPDPVKVRAAFPFRPVLTANDIRRHASQEPVLVTSRTEALDRWFHSKEPNAVGIPTAPKPTMAPSPLEPLIDELQTRAVMGWLSIGATLLSGSDDTQECFARIADELLDNPSPAGTGRQAAVPIAASVDPAEGWLFIWATRPKVANRTSFEVHMRGYLRAKKYQLGLPRGVLFLYDEGTREFIHAYYDGHIGPLDAAISSTLSYLRPASDLKLWRIGDGSQPVRQELRPPQKRGKERRKR